jgi:hypothetical protein
MILTTLPAIDRIAFVASTLLDTLHQIYHTAGGTPLGHTAQLLIQVCGVAVLVNKPLPAPLTACRRLPAITAIAAAFFHPTTLFHTFAWELRADSQTVYTPSFARGSMSRVSIIRAFAEEAIGFFSEEASNVLDTIKVRVVVVDRKRCFVQAIPGRSLERGCIGVCSTTKYVYPKLSGIGGVIVVLHHRKIDACVIREESWRYFCPQ